MKNLFLLSTDKPSYLYKDMEVLFYNKDFVDIPMLRKNQNIYITSYEEIKDVRPHKGKWQLEEGEILNKFPNYLTDLSECKLIIMTTDPELIAEGVQAIDDEFLEWFVKNPNCEEVEVKDIKTIPSLQLGRTNGHLMYKIMIPQEEPKPTIIVIGNGLPKQESRMYSEEEVFELTLNALDLGMTIRQDQLKGYSEKSGKELHKEWFEKFKKK
jgi:hypothetical protein